jgi:GNAT superfamily N-acetyltransferase
MAGLDPATLPPLGCTDSSPLAHRSQGALRYAFPVKTNVSIRRAGANDVVETAAVFTAAFASMTFVPKLHDATEDLEFVRDLIAEKEVWVAERDRRILGLACWYDGWLEQLYVDPAHHNEGAGTALLHRVMAEYGKGFQLWTFQANAGARRFYERHGFVAAEFTDGSHNEEKTPDVRYVWRRISSPRTA